MLLAEREEVAVMFPPVMLLLVRLVNTAERAERSEENQPVVDVELTILEDVAKRVSKEADEEKKLADVALPRLE